MTCSGAPARESCNVAGLTGCSTRRLRSFFFPFLLFYSLRRLAWLRLQLGTPRRMLPRRKTNLSIVARMGEK